MNRFEEILLLPGVAPILAAKLSGRIIGRMANGFGSDPALGDMMNLFKCIEAKWPEQTLSLREMFDLQLNNAEKAVPPALHEALEDLTPEQRAIWEQGKSASDPRKRLLAVLPDLLNLYQSAEADSASWDDLTTINQWSLLNKTEEGLHTRLARYQKWAAEDEGKGRVESKAITLYADANDAVEPLFDLITEFLDDPDVAEQLAQDLTHGIRVPVRTHG